MVTVSIKCAMLVLLSAGLLTVVTIRSDIKQLNDLMDTSEEQKVVGSTAFPEDNMVKSEEYVTLRQRREEIYNRKNAHFGAQPSRKEGAYYWLKAEDGTPIERCCCPKDATTGFKKSGMQCKYLHAFRDSYQSYAEHFLGLKQSSNPTKWNEWVCPGTTGMPEGLGLHHPEEADTASFEECDAVKSQIAQAEEDWQEIEDDLDAELTAVDAELRDLVSGWGCHIVLTGRKKESGTWCGAGGLMNVHNCGKKGQKGKCYTTACYTCDKLPEQIFHKRKGEGMVVDEVSGQRYISTTGAVRAHALEQCRAACTA